MQLSSARAISVLALFLLSLSPASAQANEAKLDQIDPFVRSFMEFQQVPGVVVVVVDHGAVAFAQGWGKDASGQDMTADTPMLIGSQSKSFTALAVAQLAEQGKIAWDSPVRNFIPSFRVADEGADITVDQLLHHTSGMSDSGYSVVLPDSATKDEAVRSLLQAKLTASPGKSFQYFNLGYTTLSAIVEHASGVKFEDYVDERILKPLGMLSSHASYDVASGSPTGFTRLFGLPLPLHEGVQNYGIGAGYIVSTGNDLGRFAVAMLGDAGGLVRPETLARIFRPQLGGYGMGWFITPDGAKIYHGGANQSFRTEVYLYPYAKKAFIVVSNMGYQLDHFLSASQLAGGIEAIAFGQTPQKFQGWPVVWFGRLFGVVALLLLALHTRNFLALRRWNARLPTRSFIKTLLTTILSFAIPIAIFCALYLCFQNLYGNRFNFFTGFAYMPHGMPDIFVLVLLGTIPDFAQGLIKVVLWIRFARLKGSTSE